MGRLTWSINVTLDGCCDHSEVIADEELHRYAAGMIEDADGVLLGRVTYQLFQSYWPAVATTGSGTAAEVRFARELYRKPKYVVSSTLGTLEWENSFLIGGNLGQEVSRLKQEHRHGLVVFGSPGLAAALAGLGLVDQYHFLLQPILAGHGPTLLERVGGRLDLQLDESDSFRSGVLLLRYVPVRNRRG